MAGLDERARSSTITLAAIMAFVIRRDFCGNCNGDVCCPAESQTTDKRQWTGVAIRLTALTAPLQKQLQVDNLRRARHASADARLRVHIVLPHRLTTHPPTAPKIMPVISIGAYDLVIIASGRLVRTPTRIPETTGGMGRRTVAAKNPRANREKNAPRRAARLSANVKGSIKLDPLPCDRSLTEPSAGHPMEPCGEIAQCAVSPVSPTPPPGSLDSRPRAKSGQFSAFGFSGAPCRWGGK